MKLFPTTLPWGDTPVHATGNIQRLFASRLPSHLGYHLPDVVTICADLAVSETQVEALIEGMAAQLARECETREERRKRFLVLGLFADDEFRAALSRRHAQRWVIYYSERGGLGAAIPQAADSTGGTIPCSTLRNHGVGWRLAASGECQVWLATARKEGRDWDWDSDIGHESAHAAFAPVPLFAQSIGSELDAVRFTTARSAEALDAEQLSRMCYLFTELAVVAVRGEQRDTDSGLPLPDSDELHAFLKLAHDIMPRVGFGRALAAFEQVGGRVDVLGGPAIYEIGAAALRALDRTVEHVAVPDVTQVAHRIFDLPASQLDHAAKNRSFPHRASVGLDRGLDDSRESFDV